MVTFLLGLGRDLLAEHLLEEVGVGELLGGGVLQQRLEPLAALEQPQLLQVLAEALELRGVHAAHPAGAAQSRGQVLVATARDRGSRRSGQTRLRAAAVRRRRGDA